MVTCQQYERAGLVDLVLKQLPAEATLQRHERPEMLLLCEAQSLPPRGIAYRVAEFRSELVDLSARLATRADVSWSAL